MTYRELRNKLNNLSNKQLDQNLTILNLDIGEVFPILDFVGNWGDYAYESSEVGLDSVEGTLDDNHPYFTYTE